MNEKLRWDDLKVFLHVARASGLTAAAQVLKMDPATLSRRINRLEDDMKARLFLRSPQGYDLTQTGRRLMAYVDQMDRSLRMAQGDVVDRPENDLSGTVRIGAPDGFANYLLPQVCAEICAENPGLDVQIVALPRVLNLSKREADMAITVAPPKAGRLSVQKITDYHLHLAATRSYLAQHPPIIKLDDLSNHTLIGYISDLIFADELDYMNEVGEDMRAQLTSNSSSVQLNWAHRGAGVCVIHDFAIPTFPDLQRILMDQFSLTRSFYLVRHADDRKVARLNRFAQLLIPKVHAEVRTLEAQA